MALRSSLSKVDVRALSPMASFDEDQAPFSPKMEDDVVVSTTNVATEAGYLAKHTSYTVRLRCPVTKRDWTLSTRYSAVLAFRTSLASLFAAYNQTHPKLKDRLARELLLQLAWLLDTPFPPKRLDSEASWVVAERTKAFRVFFCRLVDSKIHLIDLAHDASSLPALWIQLVTVVQSFMAAPPMLSVSYQKVPAIVRCPDHVDCSICLAPFSEADLSVPGVVVKTRCSHVFHQGCLAKWMQSQPSCPICRDHVDAMVGLYM
ncbi:hypothetical protein SPRG_14871 [Saprolegnia parasitica CBS 223.65]|uniref:RING-type domain-containing protein n=1 Tax=Saprolegnia parasitica (strain CBS 223.65) TaxID=695850 RepID=A0A067BYF8_SAPPC|nr:hypothetical protein SPRG_14871 [Saprolegnia parasitica CBS 223.65]KDO19351.1 hypothetical protein SPRG_14871 [Saprolegnia parasitica CBS 223.65]|eukprot:XP_012209939.1 hypothetical protein SPRG_14871 [Saprolegnia parasitica CBS 223.65]